MKRLLLLLLLIALNFSVQNNVCAQALIPMSCATDGCAESNSNNPSQANSLLNSSKDKYYDQYNTDLSMWIPNSASNVKVIKINFIVVQRYQNDPQNFSLNGVRSDGVSDDVFLRNLVVSLNNMYANLAEPSDNAGQEICGSCNDVKNSKIQFSLEGIHYIVDSNVWGTTNSSTYKFNAAGEINIYIPRTSLTYCWCSGYSSTNLNENINLVMNNFYNCYLQFESYGLISLLAHELGHALGLCHTYLGGGCSTTIESLRSTGNFFDDHFGSYPGRCPDLAGAWNANPYINNSDRTTNNIMGGTVYRDYWSPKQIGAMHRNLVFNNIRKYLKYSVRNTNPIMVSTDEIWDFDMILDRDIQINSLGSITLTKNIQMPDNGIIELNSGGVMSINSCVVKNTFGNYWRGIVIKSGGLLTLNSTTMTDYDIVVESGGSLKIKGSLAITGNHSIMVKSGGYLCIEPTSTINLANYNSLIKINDGALIGVNPMLNIQSNCVSSPTSIAISGVGSIIDYSQDVYIQNQTISSNKYIGGKNIFVGNHVTTSKTAGDVLINNGANVIFDCKNIVFDPGFECSFGSTYEVKNH